MFLSETVGSQSTSCVQSSVQSINSLLFFNDQCDHVTSTYRSQLQAMNRAQFAKTSKTNSVIYQCSYCFQTLKQWPHLQIKRFIKLNPDLKWILMMMIFFFHELLFFFFHEDTLTHSCRSLAENKIEQLPPGIFSDLSELRYL